MMSLKEGQQIIKIRDDPKPVVLERLNVPEERSRPWKANVPCSWAKKEEEFGLEKLRPRIEPWLTALVQSEHLALPIGAGLTHAVHYIAKGESAPGMTTVTFSVRNEEISKEAKRSATAAGRQRGNIEDQIPAANELLRGLEIIAAN